MTFLALIAIIFFGFAVYNLTCAFVDIPTKIGRASCRERV